MWYVFSGFLIDNFPLNIALNFLTASLKVPPFGKKIEAFCKCCPENGGSFTRCAVHK